ncbi:hypothetical protein OESDEN_22284 [Oesophagostomum dentatum]|uniref:Uncharacterized protein n=1 Tax=Oesophagostomum dentatum TaxID=61180 RepID=A0A0B1S2J0_OESDE|nr:hypothetical protein OESDEN_22284 [Oesophagostomum dentatum]
MRGPIRRGAAHHDTHTILTTALWICLEEGIRGAIAAYQGEYTTATITTGAKKARRDDTAQCAEGSTLRAPAEDRSLDLHAHDQEIEAPRGVRAADIREGCTGLLVHVMVVSAILGKAQHDEEGKIKVQEKLRGKQRNDELY